MPPRRRTARHLEPQAACRGSQRPWPSALAPICGRPPGPGNRPPCSQVWLCWSAPAAVVIMLEFAGCQGHLGPGGINRIPPRPSRAVLLSRRYCAPSVLQAGQGPPAGRRELSELVSRGLPQPSSRSCPVSIGFCPRAPCRHGFLAGVGASLPPECSPAPHAAHPGGPPRRSRTEARRAEPASPAIEDKREDRPVLMIDNCKQRPLRAFPVYRGCARCRFKAMGVCGALLTSRASDS